MPRSKIVAVIAMSLVAFANTATSQQPAPARHTWASDRQNQIRQALAATPRTMRNLKALGYVQNAHGQLDEWSLRLLSRLELGLQPRKSDPVVDGRFGFQVQKLRLTYSDYADSDAVVAAVRALADAHERRLHALEYMLRHGVDRSRFSAAQKESDQLMAVIQSWSKAE